MTKPQEQSFFEPLDLLMDTLASRAKTNTVFLVAALATGASAYIAVLLAIWFAIFERSNEIYASLSLAAITAVFTLALVLFKIHSDRVKHRRQAIQQKQLVAGLLSSVLDKANQSSFTRVAITVFLGWALTKQNISAQSQRQISR